MSAAAHVISHARSTSTAGDAAPPTVNLLPNACYVAVDDHAISTVLGSCIAVCIRDSATGTGGMNHFMLPSIADRDVADTSAALRYGPSAMAALLANLYAAGAGHDRLEAKVFGGGHVLAALSATRVGAANIDFVIRDLTRRAIPIVARDVGGCWPRRLCYRPLTGEAWIKRYQRVPPDTLDPAIGANMPRHVSKSERAAVALGGCS